MLRKRKYRGSSGRTGWISREDRLAIYQRDDFRCVYCDSTMYLQLDHIHPRSKGGSDHPRNLATACKSCNMAKSNRIIPGRLRSTKIANYRKERLSRNTRKRKTVAQPRKQRKARHEWGLRDPSHEHEKPRNWKLWVAIGVLLIILL